MMPQSQKQGNFTDISAPLYDLTSAFRQLGVDNGVSSALRGPPPTRPIFPGSSNPSKPPSRLCGASTNRNHSVSSLGVHTPMLQTAPSQVFPPQRVQASRPAAPLSQFLQNLDPAFNQANHAPPNFRLGAQPFTDPTMLSAQNTGFARQVFATNLNNALGNQRIPWDGMQVPNTVASAFLNRGDVAREAQTEIQPPQFAYVQDALYPQGAPEDIARQYSPINTQAPLPLQSHPRFIQWQYTPSQTPLIDSPSHAPSPPSGQVKIQSLLPLGRKLKHLHKTREIHREESNCIFTKLRDTHAQMQQEQQTKTPSDWEMEQALQLEMRKVAHVANKKDEELGEEMEKLKVEVGRIEAFLEEVIKGSSLLEDREAKAESCLIFRR